jgi:hypothetical protein
MKEKECEACEDIFEPNKDRFICDLCFEEHKILDREWHEQGDFDYSMND